MSKIFPFKPRKIKPPKQPNGQAEQLSADAAREQINASRKEHRKIMAELYAEDLERRAKKLLEDRPLCPCCGLPLNNYQEALVRQKGQKPQKPERAK